jgi:hypothetical protein
MDGWLIVATAAFLLVLLYRVRPEIGWARRARASQALQDARARIASATTDADRARALCDAASLLGPSSAAGMYLRAVRADPASPEVVERAVAGLGHRPRLLESVLWRHLAAAPWPATRLATRTTLSALVTLYEGPLRDPTRAKALSQARDTLGE